MLQDGCIAAQGRLPGRFALKVTGVSAICHKVGLQTLACVCGYTLRLPKLCGLAQQMPHESDALAAARWSAKSLIYPSTPYDPRHWFGHKNRDR
jgi:hypothetical protein